jgi:hypothetical protein
MSGSQFHRLLETLESPQPPPAIGRPYPWPEAEMITRYGLRHLTPEEQQACPERPNGVGHAEGSSLVCG